MKLSAKLTPYSSVVGGGLQLCDERGRVRFMVMICGVSDGITKEENAALAGHMAEHFGTAEIAERTSD